MPSYGPFFDPKAKSFQGTTVSELTQSCALSVVLASFLTNVANSRLFDRRNLLVACDPRLGSVVFWCQHVAILTYLLDRFLQSVSDGGDHLQREAVVS